MQEPNYAENLEFLRSNTTIPNGRLYNYEGTNGENIFLESFNFYQKNLWKHYDHGIKPAYFYFIESNDIQALATPSKFGCYAVGISKGIIETFDRKLNTYFDINQFNKLGNVISLQTKLSDDIGRLMYQCLINFTFYHELGHLIQFASKKSGQQKDEKLTDNGVFDINNHVSELDADSYAAVCIGAHLSQYLEKYYIGKLDSEGVTTYISLITSSIFAYFLSFNEYNDELYFEKSSHPHPIIRLLNALGIIVDYFDMVLKKNGVNVKINQKYILKDTFTIAEILIKNMFDKTAFPDFEKRTYENIKEIIAYNSKIKTLVVQDSNSAINIRNKIIEKKKSSM